ncbi:biotin synthase BioB [Candidatus Marinamargulisbacteria bacterium SCGC AG-343-D04]|nr:biotin synthase BioB [Candidatus Marinamargulisbacteria bacterium SCGC AG-343-D04]
MTSDISMDSLRILYDLPLLELVFKAAEVHRKHFDQHEIQLCTLLSVKTGGCAEDCSYCPQAARYNTDVEREKLLDVEKVLQEATVAKHEGSTRFCMGAAWREVKDNQDFDNILKMVKGVRKLGLEACCTLGMLSLSQAEKLKEAGLTAYNHNLDTSEDYYGDIIKTRTYNDRLETLDNVGKAGISVCCGGIIGLGESVDDRLKLLLTLTKLSPQPESVPINTLVPVPGTPLENQKRVDTFEWIRMIALARIVLPKSKIRLSAGRLDIPKEAQALAFMAGANSIFTGEKLLTTGNPSWNSDHALIQELGLSIKAPEQEMEYAKV